MCKLGWTFAADPMRTHAGVRCLGSIHQEYLAFLLLIENHERSKDGRCRRLRKKGNGVRERCGSSGTSILLVEELQIGAAQWITARALMVMREGELTGTMAFLRS